MVEILDQNLKLKAKLENAINVCKVTPLNSLATASFSLPYNDPKLAECIMRRYVKIRRGNEKPMLYRLIGRATIHDNSGTVQFQCEHVSATLIDDTLDGYVQIGNIGTYTQTVIEYILAKQSTKNWVLGRCDFARQFEYGFDNETLYACLKSVAEPITSDYRWEWDTESYPWTVNLVKLEEEATGEYEYNPDKYKDAQPQSYFRYGKNIRRITVEEDGTELATRIKPLGWGEGVNQLTIADVNNGSLYLTADQSNVDTYGVITYVWVDRRFTHPETLMARAQVILAGLQQPRRVYTLDVVNLEPLTGDKFDEPRAGDVTRCIDSELDIDFKTIITKVEETDIFGKYECKINIANTPEDIPGTIAEQADRLRNEQLYSQGSKTVYTITTADNADASNPAKINLYIPSDVVNINYINFNYELDYFRGYTKAAASGGGSNQTSSSGGGYNQTSSSGGGSNQTSSSGGGSTATSSSGGGTSTSTNSGGGTSTSTSSGGGTSTTSGSSSTTSSGVNYNTSGGSFWLSTEYTELHYDLYSVARHRHNYDGAEIVTHRHDIPHYHTISIQAHSHGFTVPAHSHSFSTPNHSHSVTIPAHQHNVAIPAHQHSVEIPAHQHTVNVPQHTHAIEYGIYRGPKATSATVTIDGVAVAIPVGVDIDISAYLAVDTAGKIRRGSTHTIQIAPNSLTRIVATATAGIFTGSDVGGNY